LDASKLICEQFYITFISRLVSTFREATYSDIFLPILSVALGENTFFQGAQLQCFPLNPRHATLESYLNCRPVFVLNPTSTDLMIVPQKARKYKQI